MKKLALLLAAVLSLTAATACGAKDASSTGIIGGADDPTSIIVPSTSEEIPAPALDQKPVTLKQFEAPTGPVATMKTSMGDLEIMLFPEEAPMAVENFITHAKAGYYDGLIFHRVIEDFMIQGGDPLGNGTGGESIWKQPFTDEFSDSLHNFRGALS
ncbi:MAG: peptidylprolyl isomerase, partial [Angelakisella sp.]